MSMVKRIRYYGARVRAHLEEAGLLFRDRSLMFYDLPLAPVDLSPELHYADNGVIGLVTQEQFLTFGWAGNLTVVKDAVTWRCPGRRWAIVARRGDQMDAFCWLEADMADLFFFDTQYQLPSRTYYFSRLWVLPGFRDQGLGRALLQFAATFAVETGADRLVAACVPHNGPMRRLFPELGWAYVKRVDYVRCGPVLRFSFRSKSEKPEFVFSLNKASKKITGLF